MRQGRARFAAVCAIALGLFVVLAPSPGAAAPGAPAAGTARTEGAKGGGAASSIPVAGTVVLRLALGAFSLAVVGLGLVVLHRKGWLRGRRSCGAGCVQIIGRAALSPRHAVYVLQLGNKRIVVGMAPERLTPLAVLDNSSGTPAAERRPEGTVPRASRARASSGARRPLDEELLPYRRQVNRLRDMLRRRDGEFSCENDAT